MTYEISALIAQSTSVAEICAGAYGYLSAAMDAYLHADDITLDALHADFHRIQHEVTKGISRLFNEQSITLHDMAEGVGETARQLGLSEDQVQDVVRKAVKLTFPLATDTKP